RQIALGRPLGLLIDEQPELVGIDALAPGTILAAEQLLDLVLQLLDPSLRLPDRLRLLADDLVAKGQVVGKGLAGVAHARILQSSRTSKRGLSGDFSGFSGVATLASDAAEIDPVE